MTMQKNSLKQQRVNIEATVFDIDETLFEMKTKTFTKSAIEALKKLQQKHIPVILATGRPPRSASAIFKEGIHPDYTVCTNGHLILDTNQNIIYSKGFSSDLCNRIYEYCKENDIGLLFKYPDKTYEYIHKDVFDHFYSKIPNGRNNVVFDYQEEHLKREPNGGNIGSNDIQREEFNKVFNGECIAVRIDEQSSDLVLNGISKKTGVEYVLQKLNINPQYVISFGDNDNDIEINDFVGIGVAMGNCSENLRKHADFITKRIDEDGVLYALQHFGLIE